MPDPTSVLLPLAAAAFAAGALNAVAGGGTLLTFPALTRVVTEAVANVTSTVALLPGSVAGAWGYRRELAAARPLLVRLLPPSLAGSVVGSGLLLASPDRFGELVPWLILVTAVLFLVQKPVSAFVRRRARAAGGADTDHPPPRVVAAVVAFQFLVAVYGGYFGAGIGILMLTALGFMGVADIHRANAVKTVLAGAINVVSAAMFAVWGGVRWDLGGVMAVASVAGGYLGASTARRLPPWVVRWTVVAIGFGLAGYYFWKRADSPGLS